jgi:plastocyanin
MVRSRVLIATQALVAVLVSTLVVGCSNPSGPSTSSSSNGGLVTVFITNGVFSPNPLTVKVGQQVNWKNNDSIEHSAVDAGVFDTGNIPALSAHDVPVTFGTVGTFAYHCAVHPGESGSIVVQP